MSNAYLLVFNPGTFDRDDVVELFDKMEGVESWFYSIPHSIFIVGTVPARTLSKRFIERFGQHRHFVTIISKTARGGWLPKEHWALLPKDESDA
jgi:hypothetical protein